MTLRRGFKAEAERLSVELRAELDLQSRDRVAPHALAEHLGVPLVGLREFVRRGLAPRAAKFFLGSDKESFSAFTLFHGRRRLIVFNDAHAPTRHASDIAHELAHCVLCHEPHVVFGAEGLRFHDPVVEAEADWQGGALLIPRDGALELLARGMGVPEIAEHFGVSVPLASWRVHGTGVAAQVRRRATYRRAPASRSSSRPQT